MKRGRLFFILIAMMAIFAFPLWGGARAEGEPAPSPSNDLSGIIADIQMITGNQDRFGKEAIAYSNSTLKIKLSYQKKPGLTIQKGDTLSIKLVPEDFSKSFLHMEYTTSILNELIDKNQDPPIKVADLDMTGRRGVDFTFTGEAEEFEASLNLPFEIMNPSVTTYFNDHPGEQEVTFKYKLQVNNKDTDKTVEYTIKKAAPQDATQKFEKTKGAYKQEGQLGDGNFIFNIRIDTELRSPNEYVIYDTPDINLGFDGDLRIFDGENPKDLTTDIFRNENTDPNKEFTWVKENENGTIVKVYDVYFLTKEPLVENDIRISSWEEKTLEFHRGDVENGVLKSMDKATVPKEILLEKPLGSPLTPEEQEKIDQAGGLYKKVGKGFKVTISDYKSQYLTKGGHLSFHYRMGIKNPSTELDQNGHPIYKNFASYYAQEIPNCKPGDENCTPFICEKTKKEDYGSPERPAVGVVKPGTIGADVIVPETGFTKVEADNEGNPLENKPLSGASFTIYQSNAQGIKGDVAKNRNGETLDNLVTDEAGKLTKNGKKIPLTLNTGYYLFTELAAPKDYEIIKKDTVFAVGYKARTLLIPNKSTKAPPASDDPKPITLEGDQGLGLVKKVEGKDTDESFSFVIKPYASNPSGSSLTSQVTVATKGEIKDGQSQRLSFPAVTFKNEGSYQFTVTEKKGESSGWTYDQTENTITVVVTKNTSGELEAKVTGNMPVFTNTYTKSSTEEPNPDKPNPDKPNPDKPNPDKPNPDKPNPDKPNPDKPNPDKPNPDKPNPDKPNPDKPNPDKPNSTRPNTDKKNPEKPRTEGQNKKSPAKQIDGKAKAPNTGDLNMLATSTLLGLSGLAFVAINRKNKANHHQH